MEQELEERTYTCEDCGEQVNENNDYWGELTDATLCESCYSSDTDYASKLYLFQPDGDQFEMIFGDHNAYHGERGKIDDMGVPDWIAHAWPDDWKGRKYESTGGYRGYYCTDELLDLDNVASGWCTGNWDDVRHKWDFNTFIEDLAEGNIVPPRNIYVLYEPTSNVFSVATTVLCDVGNLEAVRNWIAELSETDGLDVVGALR